MSNPILGDIIIKEPRILADFVKRNNPDFEEAIAKAFLDVGYSYFIRGDIAFCQSIIETGWFKFADGTAVTPDQHNYCGMGVTERGMRGNSFSTISEGVEAQIQHLYAYASENGIIAKPIVDPRFKYVPRGSAPNWEDLGGKWSSQKNYGEAIIHMYANLYQFAITHPLFESTGKEAQRTKQMILQVKEFTSESETNEFLQGMNPDEIVRITPFYVTGINGFRYSVTYKKYIYK